MGSVVAALSEGDNISKVSWRGADYNNCSPSAQIGFSSGVEQFLSCLSLIVAPVMNVKG